jgi:hypothetical protein
MVARSKAKLAQDFIKIAVETVADVGWVISAYSTILNTLGTTLQHGSVVYILHKRL